ncbi:hypothetical protein FBU30_004432 [Linnemannia zychae]|nr:hypothetical protein FBU30_004432 [Linnemannia zychae]
MKLINIAAIAILGLAAQGEAFNFGKVLRTNSHMMNSASILINDFLNQYREDSITCQADHFKAKLLSTGALCQIKNDRDATDLCRKFGKECIGLSGEWGCGHLDKDPRRACLWRPSKTPSGAHFPKIIFDHEERDGTDYEDDEQCAFDSESSYMDESLSSDQFHSASDFYAKTLVTDLEHYANTYEEMENEDEDRSPSLHVTAIVKALNLAGIHYPIGKTVCQVCKGTCNKIMSKENMDRCKFDTCVKFLGGYKGNESSPSCSLIPLP